MKRSLRSRGFTLVELVIVLLIIAALMTIALPGYRDHLLRTRRAVASSELLAVLARQEQFYIEHKRYAASLVALGYPESPFALDGEGNTWPALAPEGVYLIDISMLSQGFALHAQPQRAQSADRACGTLTLNWQGLKTVTGNQSAARCW